MPVDTKRCAFRDGDFRIHLNLFIFLFIGQKRPESHFAFSSESVFADDRFKHDSSPFCNAKFLLLYDRMSYKNIYYKKKSGRTGAAAENMALITAGSGIGSKTCFF